MAPGPFSCPAWEADLNFNHFDSEGRAHMVDVSAKEPTVREARAEATVRLGSRNPAGRSWTGR